MTNRTILLVEDNASDEALTLRSLARSGIKNGVVVMRDGAEALDYLFCIGAFADRNPEDLPAVILMDLNLPKIGGLEAVRLIREHPATKLVPVVILTSSDEEDDRLRGYQVGANSYVRKPVEFNEFANAIKQLGLYWLILNEPSRPKSGVTSKYET
jgi:two-component system response regulator